MEPSQSPPLLRLPTIRASELPEGPHARLKTGPIVFPHVDVLHPGRGPGARRAHADDRAGSSAVPQSTSKHVRCASKPALPQPVADDQRTVPGNGVLAGEDPPTRWFDAEQRERARREKLYRHPLRRPFTRQRVRLGIPDNALDLLKRPRLLLPLDHDETVNLRQFFDSTRGTSFALVACGR